MARRKKKEKFEMLWQGLVVLPTFLGLWLGLSSGHSLLTAGLFAGAGAGIGVGILVMLKIAESEKLKRSGIGDVDKMSGRQFEQFLGHLFRSMSYVVKVTRESGDYGADLVIEKNGVKTVVQAKRYKANVGIKAVQEVQASIAHYKAHEGWVVTNSGFTEAAINLAKSNSIRLIGRKELIEMMLLIKSGGRPGNNSAKEPLTQRTNLTAVPQEAGACDKCGKPMLLRKSSATGKTAYVCSAFPDCRSIKHLPG